jgi:hypothetical protein
MDSVLSPQRSNRTKINNHSEQYATRTAGCPEIGPEIGKKMEAAPYTRARNLL